MTTPKKRRRRRPISQTDVKGLVVAVTHLVEQLATLTAVLNLAVKQLTLPARKRTGATQTNPQGQTPSLWGDDLQGPADVLPLVAPTGGQS